MKRLPRTLLAATTLAAFAGFAVPLLSPNSKRSTSITPSSQTPKPAVPKAPTASYIPLGGHDDGSYGVPAIYTEVTGGISGSTIPTTTETIVEGKASGDRQLPRVQVNPPSQAPANESRIRVR